MFKSYNKTNKRQNKQKALFVNILTLVRFFLNGLLNLKTSNLLKLFEKIRFIQIIYKTPKKFYNLNDLNEQLHFILRRDKKKEIGFKILYDKFIINTNSE